MRLICIFLVARRFQKVRWVQYYNVDIAINYWLRIDKVVKIITSWQFDIVQPMETSFGIFEIMGSITFKFQRVLQK